MRFDPKAKFIVIEETIAKPRICNEVYTFEWSVKYSRCSAWELLGEKSKKLLRYLDTRKVVDADG